MAFIHNIRTVAHYEAKTLRRSWFFRLFAIASILFLGIMNIGVFSPIGGEDWESMAIASAIPHINLFFLNIGQAIVVIFLAADFLKRDKKLDTNEVLYTRSMSNMEYVLGKTLGILRLFIGLNILILLIALTINIISPLIKVDIASYFSFLFLISIPTIVFSLGFAFLVMSLLRNQAITFLVLLGYAALVIFYLFFRAGYIFDYMAIGLPVFKSGVVGHDNLSYIIFQRLLYFSFGMASVAATILIFRRLPQSAFQNRIAKLLLILFVVVAGFSAYKVLGHYYGNKKIKQLVIETNSKYETTSFATLTDASLAVDHQGSKIEVSAELVLRNDHEESLSSLTLSLNPHLEIINVTDLNGTELTFKRDFNIAVITPSVPLAKGESYGLVINYKGTISESFCYPWFTDDIKTYPYRIAMVNINKRQAFLTDEYVLLTPETHWYPVPALNYYPSNPARIKVDYTKFDLQVKTRAGLTAVTQGISKGSDGNFTIEHSTPLSGVTLAIGNYLTDTITAGNTDFRITYFPGNDYYKSVFTEIGDTLPNLISVLMKDLETSFSSKYPFTSLTFLEVPVQFFSYPKKNTQTRAEVQPSMILVPEKLATLAQSGFHRSFKQQKKRAERENQVITDKDLQIRIFSAFARSVFMNGTRTRFVAGAVVNEPSRYLLGPSFYFFKNNFYSDEFPVINSVFESHLQKVSSQMRGGQAMVGGLSENDKANLILKASSLKEILNASPGDDTIRSVLTVKGDYLFNMMRAKAGIEEFRSWFSGYLDANIFTRVDIKKFDADLQERFGFGLSEYLPNWFEGYDIPGFIVTEVKTTEVVVDERSRFQVTFVVSNPEPAPGLFNIAFRTGGGMGGGMGGGRMNAGGGGSTGMQRIEMATQGRGMEAADINGIVFMEANQAKRISMIVDNQPRAMVINTVMAKNIPGEMLFILSDVTQAPKGVKPYEGEEILASITQLQEVDEVIVDNEDAGFSRGQILEQSPLKRLLGITRNEGVTYSSIREYMMPDFWQPVVLNDYYGKYIKSAVYTRSGTGERSVTWTGVIGSSGYYDVFAYIPKAANRMMGMGRQFAGQVTVGRPAGGPGGQAPAGQAGAATTGTEVQRNQGPPMMKEFTYTVFHDDGKEEVVIDFETADPGWNKLGSYYLSPDSVKVELNNSSTGRVVVGDAVKWVKRNN
jgi:ABC-type transport system involved in multi-copper enzyme maturation permease subunit